MSATGLLVLGVVSKHGHAHGYQVRRELLSWRADIWCSPPRCSRRSPSSSGRGRSSARVAEVARWLRLR